MRSRNLRLLTPLAIGMIAAPAMAQGTSVQINGLVLNKEGGAPIPGAQVTVRSTETGFTRIVATDGSGRYVVPALPPGAYTVSVAKEGFQPAANLKVSLNLGDATPLNVRLNPMASGVVEVVATTPRIDAERSSAAAVVTPEALTSLPTFNRSFTSLATLTPQVTVDNQRGNLAISGQRGVNTSINIDGGDNNEPFFGGALGAAEGKTPFTISIEAIREYQVVTDGASAEFGRMGGGFVNAITKNGSNELSGSLFYFTRPQSMVARQPNLNGIPDSNKVADFEQVQFGFSVGGPIVKDKLFYFVAYDAQRRKDPVNFQWGGNTPVALDATLNPRDAALISRGFDYTPKADSDALFARFDYQPNLDHLIQFRINYSSFKGDAYTGTMSSYENSVSDDIKTLALVGQWSWILSPTWLNEFRINVSKDEMPRDRRATTPQVFISNVGYYGANPFAREYETKRTQITESISYVTSALQVKAGFDYNHIDISEIFSSYSMGGYSFNDGGGFSALDNFRAGNWANYDQRFSLDPSKTGWEAGAFDTSEKQIAAYVQADWRPIETLKVGLGLRWDYQSHPDFKVASFRDPLAATIPVDQSIPTDSTFSPRLSFVWNPSFDRDRLVIRGSLGRYVSPTPSVFLYQAYTVNGIRMAQVRFTSAQAATFGIPRGATFNAESPFSFAAFPTGGTVPRSDIFTFAPDFRNPVTDRFNLGADRAFFDGWTFGVSMAVAHSKNLERLTDLNLGTPVASASGRLVFPATRPNANYAKLAQYVSDAEGWYHAYTLSAKYDKADSPFSCSVFYTYAIDKDNDSNERNFSAYSTMNTTRLGDEWGYSDRDRRHTLTGNMTFHERTFTGVRIGAAFRYVSGFPYSRTFSGDQNRDGISGNDRAYYDGMASDRNGYRSASSTTIDLKISRDWTLYKTVKLSVSGEVFDLLNRHDTYKQSYITGTDLAQVTNYRNAVVGGTRQVQLGARVSF